MNPQLAGVEDLVGTYVFDLRTSNRSLRLNRFLWSMIGAGLHAEEQALLRARDWLGLVQHGANFFVLEKFARVARKTNLEVYAIMRGETFEEFMATRQVPDCR
jgi:hypothetical protein